MKNNNKNSISSRDILLKERFFDHVARPVGVSFGFQDCRDLGKSFILFVLFVTKHVLILLYYRENRLGFSFTVILIQAEMKLCAKQKLCSEYNRSRSMLYKRFRRVQSE